MEFKYIHKEQREIGESKNNYLLKTIKKDLKIQTPTLEEAYLEIIKNHDN